MTKSIVVALTTLCLLVLCSAGCGDPPRGVSEEDLKPLEITVEPRGTSGKYYLYLFGDRYKQGGSFLEAFETEVKGANEVVIRVPENIDDLPKGPQVQDFLMNMALQYNRPVRVVRVKPPEPEPAPELPTPGTTVP